MTRDDLTQTRQHWYAAYFAGDIEHLARVQADNFTVTTERGVQYKKSQIDGISSAKWHGSWFPQGGEAHDIQLAFRDDDGRTTITGQGYVVTGQGKGPVLAFSEIWEWDGATWQVLNLSVGGVKDQDDQSL